MSAAMRGPTRRGIAQFRTGLLRWFAREKRALPWRGERDPYRILVSEIMLQQTRVAVVEDRYRRFLRRFPDVKKLARARVQSVLAEWSGLGYYRRARSLHASAKSIMRAGRFPRTSAELMGLPGVGRYTANAVASIAFREPVPVVDGNVKRVLARLSGCSLSDHACWEAAAALLDPAQPGDFNQAMMELGALVCVPGQPRCADCPVRALCASRGAGSKKPKARRKNAALHFVLAHKAGRVLLVQRPRSASLMPEMWELPAAGNRAAIREPLLQLRHSITNTDYEVFVHGAERDARRRGRWVHPGAAEHLPLTGLTRKILRSLTNNYS